MQCCESERLLFGSKSGSDLEVRIQILNKKNLNLLVTVQYIKKNIYSTYLFSFMLYDFLRVESGSDQKVRIRPDLDPDPQRCSHGYLYSIHLLTWLSLYSIHLLTRLSLLHTFTHEVISTLNIFSWGYLYFIHLLTRLFLLHTFTQVVISTPYIY